MRWTFLKYPNTAQTFSAQKDRCQRIKVKPSKRWKLKDGVEFSIFVGSTSLLMNWIIILCIASFPCRENRYVIYESSLRPILRITYIRISCSCNSAHMHASFIIRSVPNNIGHTASARLNHGLISSLETRLGFRIGKVFANHADSAI